MALNGLYCADVPLSNYSLTHSLFILQELSFSVHKLGRVYTSGTRQIAYFWAKNWDSPSVSQLLWCHPIEYILGYRFRNKVQP